MEGFSGALDDILVSIYRNVLRLEKQMLKRSRQTTLSVSEVHLILCLGVQRAWLHGHRAGPLLRHHGILGHHRGQQADSKGLCAQGAQPEGQPHRAGVPDPETGQGCGHLQRICRRQLVDEISRGLSDEEKKYVLLVIRRLNEYFAKTIGDEL